MGALSAGVFGGIMNLGSTERRWRCNGELICSSKGRLQGGKELIVYDSGDRET